MQEIEAKFYVSGLEGIKTRLQTLGALLVQERVLETNIRFDLSDGRLSSEGRVLRLRLDTAARLTYKSGSTSDQGVLSRTEIEFVVEDFEKARQFLEALGYQKLFYYEKYRTTYVLESEGLPANFQQQAVGFHNCHIMLDELPYGNLVEIEGETIEAIREAANKLNLNWERVTPISYLALFERLCKKHPQLDPTDLSFAALQGLKIPATDLSVYAADV